MKKYLLAILVSFCMLSSFSQGYIGASKKNVKKGLDKYLLENKLRGTFRESDSAITLSIRTDTLYPTDFIYRFNSSGKCVVETRISCDSCIKKYLDHALNYGKLEWTPLGPRKYVSQYSKRLTLDIEEGNTAFTIRKVNWTRKDYDELVGQAGAAK